jgi:transcriptional regulator with XRE-family HTH domain
LVSRAMQREHFYWSNDARLHFAEFARALGVSQGQLSRYEQGSSEIGTAVRLRLARASGKTIE